MPRVRIRVVPYDSEWPRQARVAITELTDALPGLFPEIEHMGSTAVPGLAAKPIAGQRTHHLHVVRTADWDGQNERILRDYLRGHPAAAADYAALKQALAEEISDPELYTRRKTDLIQQLVDAARAELSLPLVPVWVD